MKQYSIKKYISEIYLIKKDKRDVVCVNFVTYMLREVIVSYGKKSVLPKMPYYNRS